MQVIRSNLKALLAASALLGALEPTLAMMPDDIVADPPRSRFSTSACSLGDRMYDVCPSNSGSGSSTRSGSSTSYGGAVIGLGRSTGTTVVDCGALFNAILEHTAYSGAYDRSLALNEKHRFYSADEVQQVLSQKAIVGPELNRLLTTFASAGCLKSR